LAILSNLSERYKQKRRVFEMTEEKQGFWDWIINNVIGYFSPDDWLVVGMALAFIGAIGLLITFALGIS
jgi:hypothetical protein